ncbi:hypothetical protein H920_13199 [Fukomys damarensis]|uniref:Uncharacterized protein n=1 Tax=Fukomys damarensis TaxID=885580 RepID=A0A091D4K4_FUKDA|nr:hypothetical protein H920_13199 [Fukomys damarensis]
MPGPGQDAVLGQLQDVALASLDWGFLEARPGVPRSEHQRQALRSLSCVLCPVGLFVHWTQCDVHWTGSSVQQERCGPQEGTGCRRARPGLAQTVLEVTADKHCVWQLLSTLGELQEQMCDGCMKPGYEPSTVLGPAPEEAAPTPLSTCPTLQFVSTGAPSSSPAPTWPQALAPLRLTFLTLHAEQRAREREGREEEEEEEEEDRTTTFMSLVWKGLPEKLESWDPGRPRCRDSQ